MSIGDVCFTGVIVILYEAKLWTNRNLCSLNCQFVAELGKLENESRSKGPKVATNLEGNIGNSVVSNANIRTATLHLLQSLTLA